MFAEWTIYPAHFNSSLAWFNKSIGFPGDHLYGMAITGYFGGDAKKLGPNPALEDIYTSYRNDSDAQLAVRKQHAAIAKLWGLKLLAYEVRKGVGQSVSR